MVAAEAMGAVYWRLLRRLEKRKFQVLNSVPVRLGKLHKLAIIASVCLRNMVRSRNPNYGLD